jgi:GNAT superfamily N-acetyltransferase
VDQSISPAAVVFRTATRADLPAIIDLLNGDEISRSRPGLPTPEDEDAAYWSAFEAIDADPRNDLVVADAGGEIVGTCQLTFIPSLSRRGAERVTIEAVHVRADRRGQGLGRLMMTWALDRARERGCRLAQLTTDKRRTDAHRFYASLGFEASHEGFKKPL